MAARIWCGPACQVWGGHCLSSQVCLLRRQPSHRCCTLPGSPPVKEQSDVSLHTDRMLCETATSACLNRPHFPMFLCLSDKWGEQFFQILPLLCETAADGSCKLGCNLILVCNRAFLFNSKHPLPKATRLRLQKQQFHRRKKTVHLNSTEKQNKTHQNYFGPSFHMFQQSLTVFVEINL